MTAKKIIIASLSVLGIINSPAFADHACANMQPCADRGYYKDAGALPTKSCLPTRSELIMYDITQNRGRALFNPCYPDWFDRIGFSGGINFDGGKFGNRNVSNNNSTAVRGPLSQGYAGENTQNASINDAYLNISAKVNDIASAFMSLSYIDASNAYSMAYQTTPDSLVVDNNNQRFNVQQAYIHFGNFDYSPIYAEFGQEFQDYGRYEIHPITEPLTQVLTESLHPALKIGLIMDGWSATFYSFQNPVPQKPFGTKDFDYGGAIGFDNPGDCFGYDLGIGYMYNIEGVNAIGNTSAFVGGTQATFATYQNRVDGVALYGDANIRSFALAMRYTTAMTSFSNVDLPMDMNHPLLGAKPWAASAQGSYGFNRFGKDQTVYAGYQISRETVNLNLPRSRYLLGYALQPGMNTNVGLEWDHDTGYPTTDGGAPQGNTNLVSVRVGVAFG